MEKIPQVLTSVLLILLAVLQTASSQNNNAQCEKRSCYPATGDLLVGRASQLFASSTCGMKEPEGYCIVSHLQHFNECFICDATEPSLSHLPENMISTFDGNKEKTWWQSENSKEEVYIQLDLEAQFHFTHLVMMFRTFRPAGMLIERSWNYGRNWTIYRYFASDCAQTFPGIPTGPQKDVDDIICTEDFSSVEPSSGGEVIFRALNPQIQVKDPYSEKVQNLLKLTNIRINFTKLHTLGDLVLDPTKPEARLKYYYAVYDLVIRGSCSCYGHAEQCLPLPRQPNIAGMVHGQCDCTHNTEGKNCEKCKAGYNDRPWKPATADDPNECRRCDCNGHATECRFDRAVYAASGNVSGGVCINCQHNTTGRKCEKCKPLHYQDPGKDFREPDSCIPCNCDSIGGVSGGECEGKNDPEAGLEAGRCICKTNVEGQRCNRCKKGFWNLQRSNPDGCEACSCSSAGTIDACDPQSGKCTCKRFVMGARCDRCQPGYWGLLESSSGCRACECDVGGSYERNCEQIKGQCRCRKGISGRKCDTVQTGNFFPLVDHLTYESEEAKVIGEGEVAPREPPPGEFVTWTGDGFTEVKDNAALEYAVTNVPYTGEYNILVRYEPKDSGIWQVNVKIERLDGLPLISGKCINATNSKDPNYGNFSAILSTPRRYVLMLPSVCMEKDVSYVVKVTYSRHQSNTGVDTILTDSMVLLPSAESVSIFQGPDGEQRRKQFDRFRCLDYHLSATRPRPRLSDVCKQLIFAMSSVIYDGGQPCNCDPSGTKRDVNGTLICYAAGGQCECKPNVIGQRCDRCSPGSYGFGPQGCSACNCDSIGSSDNLCNIQTGQCSCRIQAWGRQCNLCPPSNWGFPQCRPCRCNNHASSCHPRTGVCIDCQHNTAGNNCEVCSIGYYGDATVGTPNDCRRCQCPGGSSGNQFSKTCFLDRLTIPPSSYCDACDVGYTGRQCEQCDDGYYGNPLVPGGRCQPCSCNDNIDQFAVGNCDRLTGRCLACLYNTAGFSCERCKQGYYGDALVRNCTQCVCDARGTDPGFLDSCNYVTGQCYCLPNVIGTQCDTCADGFWNLASSKGCEKCDCCGEGSTQATCNELDGQCKCKPGYGGARCCECEDGYWGKPLGDCKPCNCNPAGSQTTQCDRVTGKCQCKPGMVGDKCDQCDVDTSGKMPQCEVCGECYYQWKVTLAYLSRNASVEIARALNLSLTPGPGNINAYSTELTELEEKLKQVEVILKSQVTTENDTKAIEEELDAINSQLQEIQKKVDIIDKELNSTFLRTTEANTEIRELRKRLRNLLQKGQKLKSDAEKILGSDIRGAYEQILKNQMRSREAEKKADGAENTTKMSEEERGKVQDLTQGPPSFADVDTENSNYLTDILRKIQELLEEAQLLNSIVCGSPPSKCGGCGSMNCTTCGGPGCNGSVELGMKALMRAKEAEEAQRLREAKAKEKLQEVHDAEVMVNMTRQAAEEALMRAMDADNRAKNASARMDQLIQDILDFLKQGYDDPEEIRKISAMVIDLRLSVTPEEIEKLAKDIKDALNSLTGIDEILEATEGNLNTANDLLERAKQARAKAQAVSEVIKNVKDALATAAKSQKAAEAAITKTEDDIKMAEETLKGLLPGLDSLEESVDIARSNVTDMEVMVPMVKEQFEENKEQMEIAEENTRNAHNQAKVAMEEAEKLQELFDQAKVKIEGKVESVQEASLKVQELKEMGSDLVNKLATKLERITIIEKETITFEDLIEEVKALQAEMKVLLDKLKARVTCYRNCNPKVISDTCN